MCLINSKEFHNRKVIVLQLKIHEFKNSPEVFLTKIVNSMLYTDYKVHNITSIAQ